MIHRVSYTEEERIKRLEDEVIQLRNELEELKSDLRSIEDIVYERSKYMPG